MDPYSFLPGTRRAIAAAGDAAAGLQHEYIGTEHLLLALLQDRECLGTSALIHLAVDLDNMRATIEGLAKVGTSSASADTLRPYTSRAKKVLEFAIMCARDDNRTPVGTEHLLLGLLREGKGIAAQVLMNAGVGPARVVEAVGMIGPHDADALP